MRHNMAAKRRSMGVVQSASEGSSDSCSGSGDNQGFVHWFFISNCRLSVGEAPQILSDDPHALLVV